MDGHGTRTTFGFVRYCFCAYSTGVRTESGAGLLYHNIRKPPTKSTKKKRWERWVLHALFVMGT